MGSSSHSAAEKCTTVLYGAREETLKRARVIKPRAVPEVKSAKRNHEWPQRIKHSCLVSRYGVVHFVDDSYHWPAPDVLLIFSL